MALAFSKGEKSNFKSEGQWNWVLLPILMHGKKGKFAGQQWGGRCDIFQNKADAKERDGRGGFEGVSGGKRRSGKSTKRGGCTNTTKQTGSRWGKKKGKLLVFSLNTQGTVRGGGKLRCGRDDAVGGGKEWRTEKTFLTSPWEIGV